MLSYDVVIIMNFYLDMTSFIIIKNGTVELFQFINAQKKSTVTGFQVNIDLFRIL
jgi:hypothetical protein